MKARSKNTSLNPDLVLQSNYSTIGHRFTQPASFKNGDLLTTYVHKTIEKNKQSEIRLTDLNLESTC